MKVNWMACATVKTSNYTIAEKELASLKIMRYGIFSNFNRDLHSDNISQSILLYTSAGVDIIIIADQARTKMHTITRVCSNFAASPVLLKSFPGCSSNFF